MQHARESAIQTYSSTLNQIVMPLQMRSICIIAYWKWPNWAFSLLHFDVIGAEHRINFWIRFFFIWLHNSIRNILFCKSYIISQLQKSPEWDVDFSASFVLELNTKEILQSATFTRFKCMRPKIYTKQWTN